MAEHLHERLQPGAQVRGRTEGHDQEQGVVAPGLEELEGLHNPHLGVNAPRPKIAQKRHVALTLLCFLVRQDREGYGLDCQRSVVSKTLGFEVNVFGVSATYERNTKSNSSRRLVRRGLGYSAPLTSGLPLYVKTQHEKETDLADPGRDLGHKTVLEFGIASKYGTGSNLGVAFATEEVDGHVKRITTAKVPNLGDGMGREMTTTQETERVQNRKVRQDTAFLNGISGKSIVSGSSSIMLSAQQQLSSITEDGTGAMGATAESSGTITYQPDQASLNSHLGRAGDAAGETVETVEKNGSAPVKTEADGSVAEAADVPDPSSSRFYLVVGILGRKTGMAREKIIVEKNGSQDSTDLFDTIRTAAWKIWPWYKRLFSLKSISGFSLYHCHADSGYHSSIDIDDKTRLTLLEFYQDYQHLGADFDDRWKHWVHIRLNGGTVDPREGLYTLEFVLRWSITKIILYGSLPVIGSLAIGLGFMQRQMLNAPDFGTELAVIQTAWIIASYVVGAAGITFAILGVVTQIADG
ncbi:hypothetical protein V8E51_013942 [Hyaloscypha variabilis]